MLGGVIEIEQRLVEILCGIALVTSAPDVLDGITEIEAQQSRDRYALDPAGMAGVVRRMVDRIVRGFGCFDRTVSG